MRLTKSLIASVKAGPFGERFQKVLDFFPTKKAANRFLKEFQEACDEGTHAESRNDCFDTAFENMFNVGADAFWDEEEFFDLADAFPRDQWSNGYDPFSDPDCLCDVKAEYEAHDIEFLLGKFQDRRVFFVRYNWKEAEYCLSAWWLE